MSLFERLKGPLPPKTAPVSAVSLLASRAVPDPKRPDLVGETMRIVGLPTIDYFEHDLTEKYKRQGAIFPFEDTSGAVVHGLRAVQSAMLAAIEACHGGFFPVGVGHGKAAVAVLAPTALDAKLAILLTTSGTLHQLRRTFAIWRRYFRVVENAHILSYDQLSTQSGTDLLEKLAHGIEDDRIAIVADEAHKLKHRDSARTRRLLRFFDGDPHAGLKGHENARFVALSGTMTAKSLRDFAHLSRLALKHLSPVPRDEHDLDAWSECIDVEGTPADLHWKRIEPLWRIFTKEAAHKNSMFDLPYDNRRTAVRKAFQERLRSSPGVVATEEQAVKCSLVIHAHKIMVPKKIEDAIKAAVEDGLDPAGEPLPDAISEARISRQLSAGFYYLWDWPHGIEDRDWMVARRKWNSLVRAELQEHATTGYDSEFLVASRIDREVQHGRLSEIHLAWRRWQIEKRKTWRWPDGFERPHPPTKTIWVDPFYVEAVTRFIGTFKVPVLVWYESRALQAALRDKGLLVRGPGEEPPLKAVTCALSSRAHGEGLNLQAWTRNLILEPMSSGERWEQVLGRTHRPGQLEDEIETHLFQHTAPFRAALRQAREDARYIEDTSGNRQKLNYATFCGFER